MELGDLGWDVANGTGAYQTVQRGVHQDATRSNSMLSTRAFAIGRPGLPWRGHALQREMHAGGATGVPDGRVAGAMLHAQRGVRRTVTIQKRAACAPAMECGPAIRNYLLYCICAVCSLLCTTHLASRRHAQFPQNKPLKCCTAQQQAHPERRRHRGTPGQ